MSEEFTIQCPGCGTYYNDLQEVCPYCGEAQPVEETSLPPEDYYIDPVPDETPLEEYYEPGQEPYPDDAYLPEEEYPAEPYFEDDDIFAVAGEASEAGEDVAPNAYLDPNAPLEDYGEYDTPYPEDYIEEDYLHPDEYGQYEDGFDEYPLPDEDDYTDPDVAPAPRRRLSFRRVSVGCLGLLLCGLIFYSGIGYLAVRDGLRERSQLAQTEAQERYQKGQTLMAEESIELAIAEFERALKLEPNFPEARQAWREAQRISQLQPTPTSETRSNAAVEIFANAETLLEQENWTEAAQILSQVRDLDPDFQPDNVSDMLFVANYQLGLQRVSPAQMEDALAAFELALQENPDDEDAQAEQAKASLYVQGVAAIEENDSQAAIKVYRQLFRQDKAYIDVTERLQQAYEMFGDELADDENWCVAADQYIEANKLKSDISLKVKIDNNQELCEGGTPAPVKTTTPQTKTSTPASRTTPAAVRATPDNSATAAIESSTVTATVAADGTPQAAADEPVTSASGSILYSAYNPNQLQWEILSVPAGGGEPKVLITNATMPALSPNGKILVYHSERKDSEGLHAFNLTTGEDIRATKFTDHILPRWGSDNLSVLFSSQEPGTGRWLFYEGFSDGKSDPIIQGDGRTADLSPDGKWIAYQGTDREGNNPGIYLVAYGGGDPIRLTTHESDRFPIFSPNGSRLAYMSTQGGNWDIYTVSVDGGKPKQVTRSPGNDGLPSWSPDASQLAFVSDAGGDWAIYTTSLSGGNLNKVTEWDGRNRPDWLMAQIWWGQ